jgi:hypothetical protein
MIEVVTSWRTLFQLAAKSGKAKVAHKDNPNTETKAAYEAALEEHDNYRDLCLKADRMMGLPDITI